jgi:hypothetical protein
VSSRQVIFEKLKQYPALPPAMPEPLATSRALSISSPSSFGSIAGAI